MKSFAAGVLVMVALALVGGLVLRMVGQPVRAQSAALHSVIFD